VAFGNPNVRRSPVKSRNSLLRGGKTSLNLHKMPLDIIQEEPEPQMTVMDLEFHADIVDLPEVKRNKKNAIYDFNSKNADKYRDESNSDTNSSAESFEGTFVESSRSRWYEYYKSIGYTTEKLVEMGLTKNVDIAAVKEETGPKSLNEIIKNLKKEGEKMNDMPILQKKQKENQAYAVSPVKFSEEPIPLARMKK
jgi:hypothetical protein